MKCLIISEKEIQTLSFEEVSLKYKPLVTKKANKWKIFEFEDLYQVGLLGLWKAYESYLVEKKIVFGGYASKIVEIEILNYARNQYRRKFEKDTSNFSDFMHLQESTVEDVTERICLEEFLNLLPEDEKTAIKEYFYENKHQSDIAKLMNISQPAVNQKIKKGIKHLKRQYEKLAM